MKPSPSQRQLQMLRLYTKLTAEQMDWGGSLVLAFGEGAEIVPVAVSIAGGTTLLVEEDVTLAKAALRLGELDFVVRSVDEALRTLKCEIRQRRPLGVAVVGSLRPALQELLERGVQPGCILRGIIGDQGVIEPILGHLRAPRRELLGKATSVDHNLRHIRPGSLQELRTADQELLAVIPETDQVRRRWIERLPRYSRDSVEAGRWIALSDQEVSTLPAWIAINPEARPASPPTTP